MTKSASEPLYYPVSLDLRGKRCVVVGGGQVALRKVMVLLESGADIEVISPELCPGLANLAGSKEISVLGREYRKGDLEDAFVAIAATDDGRINQQIAAEAREKRVLVNVVDDAESSDFIAPSIVRRGEISIAISTSGASPALARKLRTLIEEEFGEEYARLARLIGRVRTEVRERRISISGDGWQEALDLDLLLGLLRQGKEEEARAALLRNLEVQREE